MLDALAHALRTRPHLPAVLGTGRTGALRTKATRGDLADLADRCTAALHARGIGPGATVGVAVRPGPRALAVLLAVHRLGARAAVLDPGAGPDVLRARLALARPALVLADAAAQAVAGWARTLARRARLELPDLADIGPVATVGPRLPGCAPALDAGVTAGALPRPWDGEGDAVIVFTSGTTAQPRAVVHTRASLAAGMAAVADLVKPQPDLPVLGGTIFVLLPSLACGAPVALPARSPRVLVRQLRRLAPQATYLTPPQLRAALAAGAVFTGRVWTGSAPAGAELLTRVKKAGADEAWGVYALTELFPAAAVEQAEKAAFTGDGDLVGAPLPGVRARTGADGELLLSGPAARDRYLGEQPAAWVPTGDRARLDGNRIVLEGRHKDMILRRAENIYPGLYEPALHIPGVELALLVGVPAPDGDERLVAVVQPARGADPHALRAALAAPLSRMGTACPDALLLSTIPLTGRSQKPDRRATTRLAATRLSAGGRG
ncbi:class I adenylate-forming enzyme family protein [Actinacidiphila bryophytorum]|uniref:Acyl-CoA synthetase n=1 Tax=Actinacidiphila bryophytorum TaxID=1436133 RepID=A0A9W4H3P6_9ACTN|nr:class I adenylate-forming enzyme family protein [Actinacidiphila bryophytorum]MBM9438217.1 acyl--CoA ligase [Actinacidiphila bryophytorum]MBN6545404.1 acyl--CoA ligase [Actinacidiphila bryophytorum]CAG7647954.1 Acyl-CoA synthetase [Actinacidiphila bryophytorum]